MTYDYYSAKLKVAFLRLLGYIMHPWINDLAVRVYQHYPNPVDFFYIYRKALAARQAGESHITIHQDSTPATQPVVHPQIYPLVSNSPPRKIIPIANYLHRKRKKKK